MCVWASVFMNHHNTRAKHATSLIVDRATKFCKCVAVDTCVDCGALEAGSPQAERLF